MTAPQQPAWQTLPHQQLYDLVNKGPGREASRAHEEVWSQVQQAVDDGHQNLRQVLGRSAEEWIGAASTMMQSAVLPFAGWCATAVDDAGGIASGLAAQGEHAARLRQLMPGPNSFTSTVIDIGENVVKATNPGLGGVPDAVNPVHQAADSVRRSTPEAEDARRLMASYADDSTQRANGLGFWTTPPTMVVTHGPPDPPPVSGPGYSPGASPNPAPHSSQPVAPVHTPGAAPLPAPGPATTTPGPAPASPLAPDPARPGARPTPGGPPLPVPVLPTETARPTPRSSAAPVPPAIRGTGTDLPPGQGGRGVKPAPFPEPPRPPAPQNPSNWRELVAGQPRPTRPPAIAEPLVRGAPAGEPIPGAPGRAAAEGRPGGMYPPMAGAGAGSGGSRTKGRPGYLEDDSGFFADDRWVSAAVIGQDDVLPETDDLR